MNEPFRIRTFAAFAILFLLLVFGARRLGRELAAPLEGLDRFARSSGSSAATEESEIADDLRAIDWNEPVVFTAPVARSKSVPKHKIARATALLQDLEVVPLERTVSFSLSVVLGSEEPDLDSLTASLGLSDDQKARVTGLIEWRKWSLDTLAHIDADPESKDRVNELFREAVKGLLDEAQKAKYEASGSTRQLSAVLKQSGNRIESNAMKALLKQMVEEPEK